MTTRSEVAAPPNGIVEVPGSVDDATLDRIASSLFAAIPGAAGAGPESAIAASVTGARTTNAYPSSINPASVGGVSSPYPAEALIPGAPIPASPIADAVIHRAFVPAPTSAIASAIQTAIAAPNSGESWPASAPTLAELPLYLENLDGSLPRMFDDAGASATPASLDAPSYYFLTPALATSPGSPSSQFSRRTFDVNEIRRDFPILHERIHGKQLVWLDNAATTQKPNAVIQRLVQYYEHEYSNVHRGAHTLAARSTEAYENAREKLQHFIGAGSPSEIVFVRGTTEAINLVAASFGRKFIGEGDEIVLSTLEHHSNIVPWQFLAKQVGAVIRVVPVHRSWRGAAERF